MKKVVAAIDFGTSGTTYAFAFTDKRDNIVTGKWNINDEKNPSELILDDVLNLKKFGNECKEYFGDQSSSEEKFYYFKNIKMELYKNQKEIAADNGGARQPLAFIISKILIKMKQEALKAIRARNPLILETEIEWKVTVPAIWNDQSKDIMRKACENAGIFNKNQQSTFFALEPEAAACDYVMNNPCSNTISPGTTYIVCDIGGGTVDISTHKRIEEDGKIFIEEVYPPIGGNNGSTYINKKFIEDVIVKLFGKDAMNKLIQKIKDPFKRQDIYADYCDFLESIDEFKINISEDKRRKNEAKRINCTVFSEFIDKDKTIEELIYEFNLNCTNNNWKIKRHKEFKIYFPYQIMIDLTKEIIVDKTVKYINKIISNVSQVSTIIYAGSVSSNNYIISMIKKGINKVVNHYLCTYPPVSVVKGAVVFGLNPYIIKRRVSKFTIGIRCNEKWDEKKHGMHPEKKYFDFDDNCYRCKDIFSPIIERDQKISVDEIYSKNYDIKGGKTTITFYKTLYNNITFVDEKIVITSKCQKFGELVFDVGDKYDKNDRDLIIELEMGGTFISANIRYKNERRRAYFDFTSEKG